MRAFWAVVSREVGERRALPAMALLLGLMSSALVLLPAARGHDPAAVRDLAALVVAGLLAAGAPLAVGAGFLCRDWTEGRIPFYLARPLTAWQLWTGKVLANLLLVAVSVVLVLLPAMALGGRPWVTMRQFVELPRLPHPLHQPPPWQLYDMPPHLGWLRSDLWSRATFELVPLAFHAGWPLAVLGLLLLAHVAAVSLRLRGRWTVLDLVLLAATVALVLSGLSRLATLGAEAGLFAVLLGLGTTFLAAAGIAGWAQLRFGGSRLDRAHAVHSVVFWGALLVAAGAVEILGRGLVDPGPRDLRTASHLVPAPDGSALAVAGPVDRWSGYQPAFVVDLARGRHLHLGPLLYCFRPPMFSASGRQLLWQRCQPPGQDCTLFFVDLDSPSPRAVDTGIIARPSHLGPWRLDSRGRHLAVGHGNRLRVHALPAGHRVFDRKLTGTVRNLALDGGRLVAHVSGDDAREVRILTFALASGELVTSVDTQADLWLYDDPEASLLLEFSATEGRLRARDGRDGKPLLEVAVGGLPSFRRLADGRWVVLDRIPDGPVRLRLLAADGAEDWRLELPDPAFLGGEPVPGLLWLGFADATASAEAGDPGPLQDRWAVRAELWDLDRGERQRSYDGLLPMWGHPPPGPGPSRWLQGDGGRLVAVNPADGGTSELWTPGSAE